MCFFAGNRFNPVHGRLLVACAWLYALLFACSPLAHWGKYGPEPYGTACCIDWRLSNQHNTARSYTVALFIFCYILPCCVIVASYTGILVTVQASRKNMEQHTSRQTHMSSIQIIIVKVRRKFDKQQLLHLSCQRYHLAHMLLSDLTLSPTVSILSNDLKIIVLKNLRAKHHSGGKEVCELCFTSAICHSQSLLTFYNHIYNHIYTIINPLTLFQLRKTYMPTDKISP